MSQMQEASRNVIFTDSATTTASSTPGRDDALPLQDPVATTTTTKYLLSHDFENNSPQICFRVSPVPETADIRTPAALLTECK
jgi:hypothetical protein